MGGKVIIGAKMKKKDYAISAIRFSSLCMIVACHICQYYGNELAWWLNCGVQIFLLISGFLYGQRDAIEPAKFYKRNLPKILVDYFAYLIIILPVYAFISHYSFSKTDCFKLLFGLGTSVPGLGHLWYISTIVLCYLITPIVFKVTKPHVNMLAILGVFVISEFFGLFIPGLTGAWINCYVIGLLLGNRYSADRQLEFYKKYFILSVPFLVFLCGSEIFVKYIIHVEFNGIIGKIANTVFHYGHIALALFIFMLLMWVTHSKIDEKRECSFRFLDFSDKYSYDMYIVHLFFVLGPCSFFQEKASAQSIVGGGTSSDSYYSCLRYCIKVYCE